MLIVARQVVRWGRIGTNHRVLWASCLSLALLAFLVVTALVAYVAYPLLFYADWARPLFPWDPMQKTPKFVMLLWYADLLGSGVLFFAIALYASSLSEFEADAYLRRVRLLLGRWINLRGRWLIILLMFCGLPLVIALFVTPFRIPNEFLGIETRTNSGNSPAIPSVSYINGRKLEGLDIPAIGSQVSRIERFPISGNQVREDARRLVLSNPQLFWFDEAHNLLEVHRIETVSQCKELLRIVDPESSARLRRKFRDDLGDELELATRQYSSEEKDFLQRNRQELGRSLVLGRFFYHHDFIFPVAAARAQDSVAGYGSQYGKGLTQWFSGVISLFREDYRFNAYLLLLYSSYPIYLLVVIGMARACGLRGTPLLLVAFGTIGSYLLTDIETVRLGVGLAPWRHIWDVLVLYSLWRYANRPALSNWMLLAVTILISIYWSRDLGLFVGVAAIGSLVAIATHRSPPRGWAHVLGMALVVSLAWLISDPNAQALLWPILYGVNTPSLPVGFQYAVVGAILPTFAYWLWVITGGMNSQSLSIGWWALIGAALFYVTLSGFYVIYYPRLHHLIPVVPVIVLSIIGGWISIRGSAPDSTSLLTARRVASAAAIMLVIGVIGLATVRYGDLVHEQTIFSNHEVFEWNFPAAHLTSTGDPTQLEKSVSMIRALNPQPTVDILSPMEVVLLPLAGKGKNGPFTVSFDSLLTEREINLLANHLATRGNNVIFVDSRLVSGQYELPLLPDAYLSNLVEASVSRVRAHAMLRQVFSRVERCFVLEEQGPIVSAYRRISDDCTK